MGNKRRKRKRGGEDGIFSDDSLRGKNHQLYPLPADLGGGNGAKGKKKARYVSEGEKS